MSEFNNGAGSADKKEDTKGDSKLSLTEQARIAKIQDAVLRARMLREKKDTTSHKFWDTQPVVRDIKDELEKGVQALQIASGKEGAAEKTSGYIKEQTVEGIRKEPYPLPAGFEWCVLDVNDAEQLDMMYNLLNRNYVEDDDNMFRFDYSRDFLKWAVCPPGYKVDLHLAVRAQKTGKLFGVITAIPQAMMVEGVKVEMVEINFLCVHKKLRSKRLAPVLIKEITRRVNLTGVFSAVYTAGVVLPGSIGCARYYHRSLQFKKLVEVGFTRVPSNQTMATAVKLNRVPSQPVTNGFRAMEERDVVGAHKLLMDYLANFKVYPFLTVDEFRHWILPKNKVVNSYVSTSADGTVENMCSFYHLPSSCVKHPTHSHIFAAYSYYNVATTVPLKQLMNDCLGQAKAEGQDVFNALNVMENDKFLHDLRFGMGDGNLNYYLFNWKCPDVQPEEIGLVLL
ncbi:hypothetical protein TrLO_g13984 [Triparma laevis f. longispina]|uniref:Glycylpeptide N-tetradecanoyltransferase n=1 Tax=Triparma laevis f. longispina TaxID=1714387 RepID=A0A9W7CBW9_9STRA|nr:hypothetical protein TrLO_g13984 [Triparma laevis f. longispina]